MSNPCVSCIYFDKSEECCENCGDNWEGYIEKEKPVAEYMSPKSYAYYLRKREEKPVERLYTLTDLGNGYFIPTMIDGKNIWHYYRAIWTLKAANEEILQLEKDFYVADWHIVV